MGANFIRREGDIGVSYHAVMFPSGGESQERDGKGGPETEGSLYYPELAGGTREKNSMDLAKSRRKNRGTFKDRTTKNRGVPLKANAVPRVRFKATPPPRRGE